MWYELHPGDIFFSVELHASEARGFTPLAEGYFSLVRKNKY